MKFQTLLPISYLLTSETMNSVTGDDNIGNRKQCLKFHWIFKQLKNSKTTSEGVIIKIMHLVVRNTLVSEISCLTENGKTCLYLVGQKILLFPLTSQDFLGVGW